MFLGCFWAYVRQPHSHKSWDKPMPFASINSTNPRTNPWKFHEKILRIGGAGKWGFFEAAILNFLSRPFWIFFCFISVKNPALLYEVSFFSALWMVFPESWKRSCPNFYAHDCTSWLGFCLSRNYWSLLDHDLMANIWEKAISILAVNLNSSRSYLITAVLI